MELYLPNKLPNTQRRIIVDTLILFWACQIQTPIILLSDETILGVYLALDTNQPAASERGGKIKEWRASAAGMRG